MKRLPRSEDAALWALVAATVRPMPGRVDRSGGPQPLTSPPPPMVRAAPVASVAMPAERAKPSAPPAIRRPAEGIEPNRRHRIARGREEIAARLDLHGLDQAQARARLLQTLARAQAEGGRAVLLITGKGRDGEGVLRRRAPEWLAEPSLRDLVAGFAPADRRHGGPGAFYVALKRRRET